MSKIEDISDLIAEKDEAIVTAIVELQKFSEVCNQRNCETESIPNYHWKGCQTVLAPVILKLRKAWELR